MVAVKNAAKEVKLTLKGGRKAEGEKVFFVTVDVFVSCACFCILFETNIAKDRQEFHSFV